MRERAGRRSGALLGAALLVVVQLAACGGGDGGRARPGSGGAPEVVASDGEGGGASDASDRDGAGPTPGPPCASDADCEAPGTTCDATLGQCVTRICEPEEAGCRDAATERVCDAYGIAWYEFPCEAGQVCEYARCAPVVCEPESVRCVEGKRARCSDLGTVEALEVCPGNARCIDGRCRPILSNVLVLFDTSGSMNTCVGAVGDTANCCGGETCPEPWPVCEPFDAPLSRLAYSKQVFHRLFSVDADYLVRFGLLTFPQVRTLVDEPGCWSGHYRPLVEIEGDDGTRETGTAVASWFHQNLNQVVRVPLPTGWGEDNRETLLSWVDAVEEPNVDPELRATGMTPLGRSMFYAGEYLRHYVLVEGRPCSSGVPCESPDYLCSDGACTDPIAHCRQNVLVVFSDGYETEHQRLDDFSNPLVQARRLRYGLFCDEDADCTPDAVCVDGRCGPRGGGVCAATGAACEVGTLTPCADPDDVCEPLPPVFAGERGGDVLRAPDGTPLSVTTHVINVSGEDDEHTRRIARHGGGRHFTVDIGDTELLFQILEEVVDIKLGYACPPAPGEGE